MCDRSTPMLWYHSIMFAWICMHLCENLSLATTNAPDVILTPVVILTPIISKHPQVNSKTVLLPYNVTLSFNIPLQYGPHRSK